MPGLQLRGSGEAGERHRLVNPAHQCYEMRAVFLRYRGEFQSESSAGPDVPYNGFGPDLAFLDQKI